MLIDWFTLAAQIVNFLVLVWLLQRFLWAKLARAIDDRENRVAARLADADQKDKQADQRLEEIKTRSGDLERERREVLASAQREADELRLEMMQRARDDVRRQEAAWREDLDREKGAFLDELRQRMAVEVLAAVRRTLGDLACADLQHCATEVFLERLREMDPAVIHDLVASGHLSVVSAAVLPDDTRSRISAVLAERVGSPVHLEFARRPAMSWGIELRGDGQSIGWTPESYLQSLDEGLRKALEARPKVLVG